MDVLVSWIGSADLLSILEKAPEDVKKEIVQKVRSRKATETGPLFTLASERSFGEIHLLSDWRENVGNYFKEQLVDLSKTKAKVVLHPVTISNPISYEEVFLAADRVLKEVCHPLKSNDSLFIFLTPGTPAMTATWVLLGKTIYPAKFLQTCKDSEVPEDQKERKDKNVIDEIIPINFTLEGQYLSENNEVLHHLIEEGSRDLEGFKDIVGNSESLRLAKGRAKRAAQFDAPILLCGETGTGKELFARAIHKSSSRKGDIEPLNCAEFPKELLESELFGYVKGAFTGANNDKAGRFKLADGRTLFLDEIGECPLDLQAKLLRALQPINDSESLTKLKIRPIGAKKDETVDVRIIAATNRDLRQMVRDKQFREDLYYRLAVIPISLPPLRERTGDLEILANSFLKKLNKLSFKDSEDKYKKFSPGTMNFIKSQTWTGNVRELHSAIWYAFAMGNGSEITPEDILAAINPGPHAPVPASDNVSLGDGFNLDNYLDDIEKKLIIKALQEAKGIKTQAAKLLGYRNYQKLAPRIDKYQINIEDFK